MSEVDTAQTLVALLSGQKREAGRTILVTGPWGCGKTFLWKQTVAPKIERPQVYVSAFGAESASTLKGRIIAQFALRFPGRASSPQDVPWAPVKRVDSKLGRAGRAIAATVSSVGNAFLRRNDIDPLELTELFDASTVICIDDIERISPSFKIEDLLGVVNVLSEHKGFDVVLICNEDQILSDENKAKQYALHKEKTISLELHVSADVSVMFDRVVKYVVSSKPAINRILAAKSIILAVFSRSKTENLRLLAKVCRQLETLHAANIRQLTEAEVRFLTAIVIHLATEIEVDDTFFEINQFALQIAAAVHGSAKLEDTVRAERLEFLAKYFGENEYQFHAGILQAVRRGSIDREQFITPKTADPTSIQSTLQTAKTVSWRYWNDAQVTTLLQQLQGFVVKRQLTAAREVLECLAYSRFFAVLLETKLPTDVTKAAGDALLSMGAAEDNSLDPRWPMGIGDLFAYVKTEYDAFVQAKQRATRRRLVDRVTQLIAANAVDGLLREISGADRQMLEAIYSGVGLDTVIELRLSNPEMLTVVVNCLMRQTEVLASIWPDGRGYLDALIKRLQALEGDSKEQHMVRWRIRNLLRER